MTLTSVRHRRIGAAGVAAGALVASALLFTPSAQAAPYEAISDVRESQIAATSTPYAGWHQEVAGGKYQVTNNGLELSGDSTVLRGFEDSDAAVADNKNFDFVDIEKVGYTVASGAASLTIPVYVDSDGPSGDPAVLTTLTSKSTTGGDVKLADLWTSSEDIGALAAGDHALSEIVSALTAGTTKYKVIGIGVSATSAATVSDVVFRGTRFTFKNNAPVVADRTISTKINTAVSVPLTASDVDGNELTYTPTSVVGGTVSGSGATQTFTPAKNFKGNASVAYTVTDGRGGSASATVTIKVAKSQGKVDIYRIHPAGKISVRNTVYVYASIFVDGAKAKQGTTVRVYAKSKLVGTSKVNSSGKVKVKLPDRLPAGNATLKVTQVGSATLNGASDSIKVKVRK